MRSSVWLVRKSDLVLALLLPLLFLADLLYGLAFTFDVELPVSPGIVMRGAVLVIAVTYILHYRSLSRSLFIAYVVFVLLILIGPALAAVESMKVGRIARDGLAISKAVYLPTLVLFYIVLMRRGVLRSEDVLRFVEYATYFIGVALFASQVFGLGNATYGEYGAGDKGIFKAQNDTGLTCLVGLSVCVVVPT